MLSRPRVVFLAGALLCAALLAACGDGPGELPGTPSAEAPIPSPEASPQQVPSVEQGEPVPTDPEHSTRARVEGSSSHSPLTATTITGVWPDESWQIEESAGDACGDRPPEISRWALGEDYFTCGPEEDRLLACHQVEGDEALCVRDPLQRTAVRIHSPGIEEFTAPAPEGALPLLVVLEDGTTCSAVLRDDREHHGGRQSWLYCGENSALLLDAATASRYFDPSSAIWRAELGRRGGPPTTVDVRTIIYAGTPEDVREQGFEVG